MVVVLRRESRGVHFAHHFVDELGFPGGHGFHRFLEPIEIGDLARMQFERAVLESVTQEADRCKGWLGRFPGGPGVPVEDAWLRHLRSSIILFAARPPVFGSRAGGIGTLTGWR
jgi:hypothetical protein